MNYSFFIFICNVLFFIILTIQINTKMKNLLTTLFICLFAFAFGQNSLLWKIEGNGLEKPSYLYGTVHMICKNEFKMQEKLKKVIASTDQAYFEIDLANPNFLNEMRENMTSDKKISDQISKEDANYINDILKNKLGTGIETFDYFKPMMLLSLIMQSSLPCEITSLENEIISDYKVNGKQMGGLSKVSEQYAYLDRFVDINEMMKTIKSLDSDEFKSALASIVNLYKLEDIKGIDDIMIKYTGANPEIYEVLVIERNKIWTDKIPELISNKSTLVAVGSGHLAGENGLISLLRKKGYQVNPVY